MAEMQVRGWVASALVRGRISGALVLPLEGAGLYAVEVVLLQVRDGALWEGRLTVPPGIVEEANDRVWFRLEELVDRKDRWTRARKPESS